MCGNGPCLLVEGVPCATLSSFTLGVSRRNEAQSFVPHVMIFTVFIMAADQEKTGTQTSKSRLDKLLLSRLAGLRLSKPTPGMSFSMRTTAEEFVAAFAIFAILYEDAHVHQFSPDRPPL